MVHERDEKYEGQEEGEYHFSDDQANYDLEADASKGAPSAANARDKLLEKFSRYRRPIIGISAFLILIFVIFKILSPSTTETTEISAAVVPASMQKPVNKVRAATVSTASATAPSTVICNKKHPMPPMPQPAMSSSNADI